MKWLLVALALCLSKTAFADAPNCYQQDQALRAAETVAANDNTTGRKILRAFSNNGGNGTVSLHQSQLLAAQQALHDCFAMVDNEKARQKEQDEIKAYNSRPDVIAKTQAIKKANALINGRVNVETFTPIEWTGGVGVTPWFPLGKTASRAYFYTYGSKDYQTYINIKTATLGAGADYILMEFVMAEVDCRPGRGYPAALAMPTTYSYDAYGNPMHDNYTNPFGVELPIEHGTVLAAAVVGTCDAVREHNGTVNYPD
jgi:hypothetical protein